MSREDQDLTPASRQVTVLGGSGFLGQRIVQRFAAAGHHVRSASRHPEKARDHAGSDRVVQVQADVNRPESLRESLAGSHIVVNAVSLYVEAGRATFHSVHVAGAERVAEAAREAGAEALVQISGIGANRHARDSYSRSRGEGEDAVRRVFPGAVILRPSVMFATDDAFLNTLAHLVRTIPLMPLFGRGATRLQPVHADDVAKAAVCAATEPELHGQVHCAAGPEIYSYRQLIELIKRETGARSLLVPFPFPLWQLTATVAEWMPGAPVTRAQVALMEEDNIAESSPIFDTCGIERQRVETVLKEIAARKR